MICLNDTMMFEDDTILNVLAETIGPKNFEATLNKNDRPSANHLQT